MHERWATLPADARFLCESDSAAPTFRLLLSERDPLVDPMAARGAIEELVANGWSVRRIAHASGLSYDSVGRIRTSRRRIRASTEAALLEVADAANGNGRS